MHVTIEFIKLLVKNYVDKLHVTIKMIKLHVTINDVSFIFSYINIVGVVVSSVLLYEWTTQQIIKNS